MYWHVLFVLTSVIFPHAHLMYWQAVFSPMYVVCKINVLTCYPSHKRDNRDIRGHDHILVCIWQIGLVSVLDETLHIKILYIFFTPNVFSYCYVDKASKVFKFCVFPAMMDHITPVYFWPRCKFLHLRRRERQYKYRYSCQQYYCQLKTHLEVLNILKDQQISWNSCKIETMVLN